MISRYHFYYLFHNPPTILGFEPKERGYGYGQRERNVPEERGRGFGSDFAADRDRPPRISVPLPNAPPFTAYVGSLPYDVKEMDIEDLFKNLTVRDN